MILLCSNRPEPFGPKSGPSYPLPTTCFTDTILIPLPIWLAFAVFPILIILTHLQQRRGPNSNPSPSRLRALPRRTCAFTAASCIYYILIICNILMQTVEIVRLALLKFGVGLIPFVYVGLVLGGVLHYTGGVSGRVRRWEIINYIIWLGGVTMCVIKAAALAKEGIHGRKGSKYPRSDQVLDIAVMAGLYAIIAVLEVVLSFWRKSRQARANGGTEMGKLGAGAGQYERTSMT